jgi:hypothetical protein
LEESKISILLYLMAAQEQVDTRAKKNAQKISSICRKGKEKKNSLVLALKKSPFRVLRRCLLLLTAALPGGQSGHSEAKYSPFSYQST